jgi:hypothetical protein
MFAGKATHNLCEYKLAVLSFTMSNSSRLTQQHLRQESIIDGTAVTIILWLHILIAHHIFIFEYVNYFKWIWCI